MYSVQNFWNDPRILKYGPLLSWTPCIIASCWLYSYLYHDARICERHTWWSHDSLLYIQVTVYWDVTNRIQVYSYQLFGRTPFLDIQRSREHSCSEHYGSCLPNYKAIYLNRTINLRFKASKAGRHIQYFIPYASLCNPKLLHEHS
jgi:hypothetical protein